MENDYPGQKIVFDKNYIAIGRIVGIEKDKTIGKVQTIWVVLFPDIKHLLKWKFSQPLVLDASDFRDMGEFPKLIWNLKELGRALNRPLMLSGKDRSPKELIDRTVMDCEGRLLGKVVDVKKGINDTATTTFRLVLHDTEGDSKEKEARISTDLVKDVKKDIILSLPANELKKEWSEVITTKIK